jgi:hypothetical protein
MPTPLGYWLCILSWISNIFTAFVSVSFSVWYCTKLGNCFISGLWVQYLPREVKVMWRCMIFLAMIGVWCERNSRIFQDRQLPFLSGLLMVL